MRVLTVVGARPQFVKAAAISRAVRRYGADPRAACPLEEILVHTGQHFDHGMSGVFFDELDLPPPAYNLGIAGGPHGAMTGRMLESVERVLLECRPDRVIVHGDTNSTLAGALAAAKLQIPVAHVEAGLRSFERRMPEELNRIVVDHLADLHFAPTATAVENLRREGITGPGVELVGDVMLDAFRHDLARARDGSRIMESLGLTDGGFILATVHRALNTDDPDRLQQILGGLADLSAVAPVVLPLHPRTRAQIRAMPGGLPSGAAGIRLIEPVGYLDMLRLESGAGLIATDSGGVQKEAFMHGVPCLTLREETEWVELVAAGGNVLVGADRAAIAEAGRCRFGARFNPPALFGAGDASDRIVRRLCDTRG
ncbi:MAG: UDP-N-acetylglucosamine 2-epimerase (non-hydrolyzing) [Phycisphaeraceae bacterium]|nr:UDP-N-acetylglucosamine 2-epimerase (non-hydrolyzing) [Phycisphaeraceae bacterium]